MKTCSKCKQTLSLESFTRRKDRKDGYSYHCRNCTNAYTQQHYRDNKRYYKSKAKVSQGKLLEANRELVLRHFASGCVDCGLVDYRVLEFDHLGEKEFNVSSKMGSCSPITLAKEIAKCEVVCANCHRIRTSVRADNWRTKVLPA